MIPTPDRLLAWATVEPWLDRCIVRQFMVAVTAEESCSGESKMPKQLQLRSDAREKVLRGATALTDAIRVTLGPKSKCVLIEKF